MKRLFFIAAFLLQASSSFCQSDNSIHWLSLEDAINKNKIAPKKIFIDVYTGWCGWCKRMDATTFSDKDVINYMNEKFYPVKLDAETKDTITYLDKQYYFKPELKANEVAAFMLNGQMGYPTSVYLDENSSVISPVQGYLTKEQLLPVLKYFAENTYKTKKWDDFLKETFKN